MIYDNLHLIAAVSKNQIIGLDGKLPWNLPEDLRRFRQLTLGHIIIVGRKTYNSLPGPPENPLDGRQLIVLTKQRDGFKNSSNVIFTDGLDRAHELIEKAATEDRRVFVGGGPSIYSGLIKHCSKAYITYLDREFTGDAKFPAFDMDNWIIEQNQEYIKNDGDFKDEPLLYKFQTWKQLNNK